MSSYEWSISINGNFSEADDADSHEAQANRSHNVELLRTALEEAAMRVSVTHGMTLTAMVSDVHITP